MARKELLQHTLLVTRRGGFGGVRLGARQDAGMRNPTFIAEGNAAAAWLAQRSGGIAQSMVAEALANIPTTAHILGGAAIDRDATCGVVDAMGRVFGYGNLIIWDGSLISGLSAAWRFWMASPRAA